MVAISTTVSAIDRADLNNYQLTSSCSSVESRSKLTGLPRQWRYTMSVWFAYKIWGSEIQLARSMFYGLKCTFIVSTEPAASAEGLMLSYLRPPIQHALKTLRGFLKGKILGWKIWIRARSNKSLILVR